MFTAMHNGSPAIAEHTSTVSGLVQGTYSSLYMHLCNNEYSNPICEVSYYYYSMDAGSDIPSNVIVNVRACSSQCHHECHIW